MNLLDIVTGLFFLSLTIQCVTSELIKLDNQIYNVTFEVRDIILGHRLELMCRDQKTNIQWYFRYFKSQEPFHSYPFQFCNDWVGCGLEDSNTTLVLKQFSNSSAGNYICVDGVMRSSRGYTVTVTFACPITDVTMMPFRDQMASVGDNVTFTCEADVGTIGCEHNIHITLKRNGTVIVDSLDPSTRNEGGNIISRLNYSIVDVKTLDFNSEIECEVYDIDVSSQISRTARLIKMEVRIILEDRFDVMPLAVALALSGLVIVCLTIIMIIIFLYYPRIHYWYLVYRNKLPEKGDKMYDVLILYNGQDEIYRKLENLKATLQIYKLKEYPPGPRSSDQQAGYSEFGLLDQLCQECSCVIIFGEVGEFEERCLPCFGGRHVTHVCLSESNEKKMNSVLWPTGSKPKDRRWKNFICHIRGRLPKVENKYSRNRDVPESEMLTNL